VGTETSAHEVGEGRAADRLGGGAVKFPPLLLVPALLGSAGSRREAGKLVCAAVAIPAIVLAPLLGRGGRSSRRDLLHGRRGLGGLSLVVDPALGWHYMTVPGLPLADVSNGATQLCRTGPGGSRYSRWWPM
jgi:hypothetical protein